jgi:hypothetical protein
VNGISTYLSFFLLLCSQTSHSASCDKEKEEEEEEEAPGGE